MPGELTFAVLERSFAGRQPFTVGFDIDDTTLLSSFAFAYADGVFEASGGPRYRDDLRYWTLVNDSLDGRFSRPKESIRPVIAMHAARGDTIVFVTGRHTSAIPSDRTSRLLMQLFGLASPPRVVFTERAPKAAFIRAVHPAVFYGDADADIEDARAADPRIRAIRIIRGPCSTSSSPARPGRFGEEVLAGSAY
ncbi:MAG: acid phosphatase AphA [Gemmatimonadales bacterium]|nr:acid phosphatase AphA [Gemmatimonadales bacterium]